jgi:hypothetical protein
MSAISIIKKMNVSQKDFIGLKNRIENVKLELKRKKAIVS